MDMISLNEAAAQGIERVRKPNWANPRDYVKLDIVDGRLGPWLHLYSPINQTVLKQANPQHILWAFEFGTSAAEDQEFVPYDNDVDPDESAS